MNNFDFTWVDRVDGEDYVLAEDVNSLADGIKETQTAVNGISVPTKTSELENDSNYVQSSELDSKASVEYVNEKTQGLTWLNGVLTLAGSSTNINGGNVSIQSLGYGVQISGGESHDEVSIKDLSIPINDTDAANKKYVDDKYTVLSQSEYDAITEKEPDKIYFVYEDET